LAFSNDLQYLAVSSDKGTIHVFNLKINVGSTANDKPMPSPDPEVPHIRPSLSFIKGKFPIYPGFTVNGIYRPEKFCFKIYKLIISCDLS
jgi:hypothetical protein